MNPVGVATHEVQRIINLLNTLKSHGQSFHCHHHPLFLSQVDRRHINSKRVFMVVNWSIVQ